MCCTTASTVSIRIWQFLLQNSLNQFPALRCNANIMLKIKKTLLYFLSFRAVSGSWFTSSNFWYSNVISLYIQPWCYQFFSISCHFLNFTAFKKRNGTVALQKAGLRCPILSNCLYSFINGFLSMLVCS